MASKDSKMAKERFNDQIGQWRDVTSKSVKEKQNKAWAKLLSDVNKIDASKKKNNKGK